ncbi:oligosaccharide flippase family protein [Portibacter marinus]|uniref:oligosaccharide flippase family protein n=1 Tax=Portibacter marinus TaxID=2898660 RepID=UPI001F469E9A|nr:polysaccharide biosynthesis C-terminal domain-containing protein [Portibacter marinus]
MKQKFTANILFLVGINILIKPFYALAIDTSVQNIVGPEEYGLFLAIFNFVYIQQIFSDLGVQNFNNRDISQNPEKLPQVLPKTLASKVLFSIAFVLITLFTSWIFGYLKYLESILIWVIGSQVSLSMLLYLRTNVSGSGRYFTDSFFSVLDKLILIIWMSYVIWGNPNVVDVTITYFVQVQFYSILITEIFVLFYTHKRLSPIHLHLDWSFVGSLLRESLPYATLIILMAGYSRLDGIMLEQLLDDNAREAGEYARSFRLYDTFNNFMFLFAVLLLPMFSRMLKAGEDINALVLWAFRLLLFSSFFGVIMVYFHGTEILSFFYDAANEGVSHTFLWLMIAGVSLSLNYIYGTLLTANGNIKTLNGIAIVGFIINIVFNFVAIPKYGKEGAAGATAVTQTIVLIFQMYFCFQYFKLESPLKAVSKIILVGIISVLLFFYFETLTYIHFGTKILIVGILSLGLAFIVGLIRRSDFKVV